LLVSVLAADPDEELAVATKPPPRLVVTTPDEEEGEEGEEEEESMPLAVDAAVVDGISLLVVLLAKTGS
jgi:hypothetical protein